MSLGLGFEIIALVNKYELTLVLNPEDTKGSEALVAKVKGWVEAVKGKVEKTDKWGVRDLSYPIRKMSKGLYYFLFLELPATEVGGIERRLRLEKEIARYLLVKSE